MLIDHEGDLWTGGPGGVVHWYVETNEYIIYTTADGLASNEVVAIAQTPDGMLWFGSFGAGISRFDGVSWQTYNAQNGLPGDYIVSLFAAPDGTLVVDTSTSPYPADPDWAGHLGKFDGHNWIPLDGGGFDKVITALDGTFWASTFGQGLWHFDEGSLHDWFPLENITALAIAPDEVVWVATTTNAYRVVDGTLHKLDPPWVGHADTSVATIAITPSGIAWFGFSSVAPDSLKCGFRSPSIREWGAYRYDGSSWSHITVEDGLVDDKICAIVIGPDESIWFGSFDNGVSYFDGSIWTTYIISEQTDP
jgi:ligand-binding sensor domain-containing protein